MKPLILVSFFISFAVIPDKNAQALETENIVNGYIVKPGKYTYQVRVSGGCGGGIIAPKLIVTAAHCLFDNEGNFKNHTITVIAGAVDLNVHSPTRVERQVVKAYVPKVYNRNKTAPGVGDLAILKLDELLDLGHNSILTKLDMPPNKPGFKNFYWKKATITGYGIDLLRFHPFQLENGTIVMDGYSSKIMSRARAIVLDNQFCQKILQNMYTPLYHICAHVEQNSEKAEEYPAGTCKGDSGGPLVYKKKYLIGILSSGPFDCDEAVNGGLYTSTIKFRSFFNKVFNNICDEHTMDCFDYSSRGQSYPLNLKC